MIGVICASYYENGAGESVLIAFGITLGVFLALTIFTLQVIGFQLQVFSLKEKCKGEREKGYINAHSISLITSAKPFHSLVFPQEQNNPPHPPFFQKKVTDRLVLSWRWTLCMFLAIGHLGHPK